MRVNRKTKPTVISTFVFVAAVLFIAEIATGASLPHGLSIGFFGGAGAAIGVRLLAAIKRAQQ
jgi:hypothetical protein